MYIFAFLDPACQAINRRLGCYKLYPQCEDVLDPHLNGDKTNGNVSLIVFLSVLVLVFVASSCVLMFILIKNHGNCCEGT